MGSAMVTAASSAQRAATLLHRIAAAGKAHRATGKHCFVGHQRRGVAGPGNGCRRRDGLRGEPTQDRRPGKDGAIRKTFGPLNPQGVRTQAFKRPTQLELEHDFLWRVHPHTPRAGHIQIFNRSHYEDVLVVRVHGLVPEERWRARYAHIRNFERLLVDEGTHVMKFMRHISQDEQKERLRSRLDDPEKHWKFDPNDLRERARWDEYMAAYQEALVETSTAWAPWYVIPADRKWFRNYCISTLVRSLLESLEMRWPEPAEGLDQIVIDD